MTDQQNSVVTVVHGELQALRRRNKMCLCNKSFLVQCEWLPGIYRAQ